MSGFQTCGSLYDASYRLEMSLRVYIMLRRLTQLQKVAENDSFWCRGFIFEINLKHFHSVIFSGKYQAAYST